MASGRYLAIDTAEPVFKSTDGQEELWYQTYLVDDDDVGADVENGFLFFLFYPKKQLL